jgi:hypothetical protein
MISLKEQIKNYLFDMYPQEMSSGDIENFAKSRNFNAETGRKRCGDLVKEGLVITETRVITKLDGKNVEVAFHKAVIERRYGYGEKPLQQIKLI